MKKGFVSAFLALSTTVTAQPHEITRDSCDLPNVSFVCYGYDFTIPVLSEDSVWIDYDVEMENDPEAWDLDQVRKDGGYWGVYSNYNRDSLIEHQDYLQTISLDFNSYTITYYSAEKFNINNIIGVFEEPLAFEPGKYIIVDENEDGVGFNRYIVDFVNGTIVATDAYLEYLEEIGTLKLNVAQFIKY
jgi:hypothetical protein